MQFHVFGIALILYEGYGRVSQRDFLRKKVTGKLSAGRAGAVSVDIRPAGVMEKAYRMPRKKRPLHPALYQLQGSGTAMSAASVSGNVPGAVSGCLCVSGGV